MNLIRSVINHIKADPRWIFLGLLAFYNVWGMVVLGFNRSPWQIVLTIIFGASYEIIFHRLFKGKWIFPLSALITSCGIGILLNFSHHLLWVALPIFFAISSKYIFTFKGKHFYNPALFGVVASLILTNELITAAPAYQWYGYSSVAIFLLMPGLLFIMPQFRKMPLITSFLITYTIVTALRAFVMRHHLPFGTIFWGTLTSPPFFLFTFFMITDPATSPTDKKDQIRVGIALALVDLLYHVFRSYHTFFYAAFTVATYRALQSHLKRFTQSNHKWNTFKDVFVSSGYYKRLIFFAVIGLVGLGVYRANQFDLNSLATNFTFEKINTDQSTLVAQYDRVFDKFDPRVQHIAKWIATPTDAVAIGDYDQDGLQDIFLANTLKRNEDRHALYKNMGNFQFKRIELPALKDITPFPEKFGLTTLATFVDYDNDDDLDLFLATGFGYNLMLKNLLKEKGKPEFANISEQVGVFYYNTSVAANFLDVNRDGYLDLIMGNTIPKNFPDYKTPTPINLFNLPKEEYEGDERMYNFMHTSWHMADNGGENELLLQNSKHTFDRQDSKAWNIPETRWSLAIGTADLNQDGFTDMYVANDFGPDDLYYNDQGKTFKHIKGKIFGSISHDTYKGMNASIADFDRNGWLDVYVSNVHHPMQAEGSLLWMFHADGTITDEATKRGALNEHRFGWGAATQDFNNDGWVDIAQANGMVNDKHDKRYDRCPDYWYINEKIARSSPSIHKLANHWGDVRGACIHGYERNRLYLNLGKDSSPQFVDISSKVNLNEVGVWRGASGADFDNDGFMDLIISTPFEEVMLYRNKFTGNKEEAHWIGFDLKGDGKKCNKGGIGSQIRVFWKENNKEEFQLREAMVIDGLSNQNDRRIHFGLGKIDKVERVEVTWCAQWKEIYTDIKIDQYQTLQMTRVSNF